MKRIKYFSTFIEKLINTLPIILSILIFVCLKRVYPRIIGLISELGIDNSDILSFIVDIGIFVISSIPLLFSFFKSFFKQIKSYLYRNILRIYFSSHNKLIGSFCGRIINIFFKVKKLEIKEQNTIVVQLFEMLKRADGPPRLAFLTGSAYSGKTTTILMFLEELILNRNYVSLYEKLGHKIYYYDFDSQFSFEDFNNDYVLSKYDNSLLIIDNLHRESEDQFIKLIDLILSAGNKAYGIFVVFRKPEEFLINQTKALNLYNSISEYCINLDCSNKAVKIIESRNRLKFESFLTSLEIRNVSLKAHVEVYIHLYKMYENYTKYYDKKVFKVFRVLQGHLEDPLMRDTLITIFLLCLHLGKFTKEDYFFVMKELKHSRLSSMRTLDTLLSINFIEREWYEVNSGQYLLHEELAKNYLQYILQTPANYEVVSSVSKTLYHKLHGKHMLLGWYYSLFCRDAISYQNNMFDRVLNHANVKNMLATMQFYWEYIDQKNYILCREYGVLNSIVGNEGIARKYLVQSYELHPIPETLLELFEVKHKYYLEFEKAARNFSKETNPYVRLGLAYWEKHINMHFGKFDFCSYLNDADLIMDNMQRIQKDQPYEGYHLLRRWYFDYFKIFFLSGISSSEEINFNHNSALYNTKIVLAQRSADFEHYNQVYVLADYIQYVILFRLRIEGIYPSSSELNFVELKTGEDHYITEHCLQHYASELYDHSIQVMKKNGDHAFWHVINRKIDLLLQDDQCDFKEVEAMLERYMQHAFEIKCYEYVAYANMFLLKVKLISQLVFAHEDGKNDQIEDHIQSFRKYYRKHNSFQENLYAEVRLEIFEALFAYQSKHLSSEELKNTIAPIRKICKEQKYQRELTIIKWLKKREYCLSPGELKFLYQSYPIIIQ